ncbi:MAG: pantetheine-phosphate adenylyltransferase [Fibrobacter sp.]|nr:pantetheine-phosphate adenylyltransferase [Fibrobacter sp.]
MKSKTAKNVAVFAGSFDPFTAGHLDIARRAAAMFDELYILVAVNATKKYCFSADFRKGLIVKACEGIGNVTVAAYDGLTTSFMKTVGARYLVRGVRNGSDMNYEQSVDWNNKMLYPECETVYLSSSREHLMVSSTLVRELLKCGTPAECRRLLKPYVPACVLSDLINEYKKIKL